MTDGDADYAVMDANEFDFAQHLYPDVSVAFTLPDTRPLQWVVRARTQRIWLQEANRFFAERRSIRRAGAHRAARRAPNRAHFD